MSSSWNPNLTQAVLSTQGHQWTLLIHTGESQHAQGQSFWMTGDRPKLGALGMHSSGVQYLPCMHREPQVPLSGSLYSTVNQFQPPHLSLHLLSKPKPKRTCGPGDCGTEGSQAAAMWVAQTGRQWPNVAHWEMPSFNTVTGFLNPRSQEPGGARLPCPQPFIYSPTRAAMGHSSNGC